MSMLTIPPSSLDHQKGNVNAAITIVQYGDFQCPDCRRAYPFIKDLLQRKQNHLHFVFRHFPWKKIHPMAFSAAMSAEAAANQGKFWPMHDLIFENQPKLTAHYIRSLAKDIGLDIAAFEMDLQREEIRSRIEHDLTSGIDSGVNRTPGFFVNGLLLSTYDGTYTSLDDAITFLEFQNAI